jgi:predicted transcriptional regulator of viral defense system
LALSEYLAAPFPGYISMQSALYYHGMISQVPAITYSVSPARTHIFKTSLGTFSIHHINPSFFFGYEPVGKFGIKMATPEKALLDFLYYGTGKVKIISLSA